MKKICVFTQTYSDDRKILFDYHNLDKQDIKFRNNFDNLFTFHNCSEEYRNEIINCDYFKKINNIEFAVYNDITYTETLKLTMELLKKKGYDYIIFLYNQGICQNLDYSLTPALLQDSASFANRSIAQVQFLMNCQ